MATPKEEKKLPGCLVALLIMLIIGGCVFGIIKFIQYQNSQLYNSGGGTTSTTTDKTPQLFSRSARNNDVVVDYDMDLSSFGVKYTVMPQIDIERLEITIHFLDKNNKKLASKVETLGNVKKGVQVSFSVSLLDLGLSVAWNTQYNSIAVTGGTVSYFA